MQLTLNNIFTELKSYLILTFGLAIYCFAWTGILAPAEVMGGGASGVGLLVYNMTGGADGGVQIGTTFFIFNAILLVIAFFTIGPKFGAKTIYGIIIASILLRLGQTYLPPNIFGIGEDKLLSSILGGAMCGLGISITFGQGGSSGGTDIIALILNKYYRISFGRVIVMCDIIIVGSAYFIFKDISAIIYGYITMGVLGYTLDLIMQGSKQTVQIMIMSKKYNEVADAITQTTPRGVTVLKSMGWYTKSDGCMIVTFCRRNEISIIHHIIKQVDPEAFVTNTTVTGVYGKGFDELKVSKIKNKSNI